MPESVKPLWDALYNEVVAVHARWIIYRQLFAKSEQQINVLNECAATFFYVIQGTLLDDVQLTLSKLADPAVTMGRENATLERLADEIAVLSERPFADQLSALLAEYRASCKAIKTRRNRQISHYDHATLLQQYGNDGSSPAGPSRQEIEDALAALRCFMEPAEDYLTSFKTAYENFNSRFDGESLISVLRQGLRYQDLQNKGVIPRDDFTNSDRFEP